MWSSTDLWLSWENGTCTASGMRVPSRFGMLVDLKSLASHFDPQLQRPNWMAYSSPLELCQMMKIFMGWRTNVDDLKLLTAVVSACQRLQRVKLRCAYYPPIPSKNIIDDEIEALSCLRSLKTVAIRLELGPPIAQTLSLDNPTPASSCFSSFGKLRHVLTHLEITGHADVRNDFSILVVLPSFPSLEHFALHMPQLGDSIVPITYGDDARQTFSDAIGKCRRLKHVGFDHPQPGLKAFPETLTSVSIVSAEREINVMELLKVLVHLESLIIKTTLQPLGPEIARMKGTSVRGQKISCGRLKTLQTPLICPQFFLEVVASQCALLEDVVVPSSITDEEIFVLVDKCKFLRSIGFARAIDNEDVHTVTYSGFDNLRKATRLSKISLDDSWFVENVNQVLGRLLQTWIAELPSLERVYFADWNEWYSEETKKAAGLPPEINLSEYYFAPTPFESYLNVVAIRKNL